MSIIFGVLRTPGAVVVESELFHLAEATARFAIDGFSVKTTSRIGMGLQPYYTHDRSMLDTEPVADRHRNMLCFDGRLDNHVELSSDLSLDGLATSDFHIVLAAFMKWGPGCFSRFIGDWALALWSDKEQSLYLARDHAGTRTLYFQNDNGAFRWSTHLDTFFIDGPRPRLDEHYAACYLADQPIRDLTPYTGVNAVLPAHYVIFHDQKLSSKPHWQWMATNTIRYKSDEQYEEHFRALFRQAVERRTGPGAPIVAQLSGGMDSSSIVCMSDRIRREQDPAAELLDTISFYDDTEPGCDERPYFSLVEAERGKIGIHIETSFLNHTFEPHDPSLGMYLLPAADSSAIHRERVLDRVMGSKRYRVILNGTGGDEVLGGNPVAYPELADYLMSGDIRRFVQMSTAWCLTQRTPLLGSMVDTLLYAFRLYLRPEALEKPIPPWLATRLCTICINQTSRDPSRGGRLGSVPHVIDNGIAWWTVLDTLPHLFPKLLSRPEYRYPFLDRDLVDYLFSIPREQVIRPGRRRSLMRRAMAGLVPVEIIERRRKAFMARGPLTAIRESQSKLETLLRRSLIARAGFVDPDILLGALERTAEGTGSQPWPAILRAVTFELWLQANANVSAPPHQLVKRHDNDSPAYGLANKLRAS